MSLGASRFPVAFDQPMKQTFLFHEDRLEWDSSSTRKAFGFDEITAVRFHPISGMDTRNPFFEIRTRDGRKGKVHELARVRELFGLFRGLLAPAVAERLRGEIERGGSIVFDEERHRAVAWLVTGGVLAGAGLLFMMLIAPAILAGSGPPLQEAGPLAFVAAIFVVPGLILLGKFMVLRNRGVVVGAQGVKRALASKHPWVPWHEIQRATVLDQQIVLSTAPGTSPVTLSWKATNYVVFPVLVRSLMPAEIPWEWKLDKLRPGGGPAPQSNTPRWKTVDG